MRKKVVDLLEALQSKNHLRLFPLRDLRPNFKALRGLQVLALLANDIRFSLWS